MPTTPYAKLLVIVNGGPPQTGGIHAADGDTILLRGESTVGWQQQKFELYDFPVGMALPAGWSDPGDGTYFYATDAFPPSFAVTPWGKFMFRLTVNDGRNGAGAADQTLVDETTALSVPSPAGIADLGFLEGSQFSAHREWTFDQKANLRLLSTTAGITMTATAPLKINGDNAAHPLNANMTFSITAATGGAAGSMSAADKSKLDAATADPADDRLALRTSTGALACTSLIAGPDVAGPGRTSANKLTTLDDTRTMILDLPFADDAEATGTLYVLAKSTGLGIYQVFEGGGVNTTTAGVLASAGSPASNSYSTFPAAQPSIDIEYVGGRLRFIVIGIAATTIKWSARYDLVVQLSA